MLNKKSQLQLGETIFVIFIIILILVIAFVVYSKFQEGKIKEERAKLKSEQIVSLAHTLTSWSELECSVAETKEFDCFDITKLEVFSEFIDTGWEKNGFAFGYYHDLLKDSKIVVKEVYPFYEEWVLYENEGKSKTVDRIIVPMTLYNPLLKTYAFGIMELYVYE